MLQDHVAACRDHRYCSCRCQRAQPDRREQAGPPPGPGSAVRQVPAARLGSRAERGPARGLSGQRVLDPDGQVLGDGRRQRAGEQRSDSGQLLADLGAAAASGQVGTDTRGLAPAQIAFAEPAECLGVDMASYDGSSPPPCAGRTSGAADRFRPGRPGAEPGRRWASRGSSRARPRAHRLFTVPCDTPRISAASATG